MIELEFLGAARTVTGSRHLLRTERATILLDCGLFQGRRAESTQKNRTLGFDVDAVDAVVLSHAHIDHSGALPLLVKQGYARNIYTTPATRDLCAYMLQDAAMVQASDARHVNKLIDRGELHGHLVEPLYDAADVKRTMQQMVSIPYHRPFTIAGGVRVELLDAGHVLGSAIVVLDIEDRGVTRRLCFSGDLGRAGMPILRDPEVPSGAELLILESTYGDRQHPAITETHTRLGEIIRRTHARGGKVIIPAFALERAQEIVYALKLLTTRGQIPQLPVYVDSPLTVDITDVFRLHPECYDDEARALIDGRSPFDFPGLRYVSDPEESKALDASPDPCVIISASGMCEFGRVLHHLRATIGDERNTVCIVGFQAQHTLGRRFVEQRSRVRIFGVERERRCEIAVLNGFSAHADQRELIEFAAAVADRGALSRVVLVHGEPRAQELLHGALTERGFGDVRIPAEGDRIALGPAIAGHAEPLHDTA